jgi:hypothetical protein
MYRFVTTVAGIESGWDACFLADAAIFPCGSESREGHTAHRERMSMSQLNLMSTGRSHFGPTP